MEGALRHTREVSALVALAAIGWGANQFAPLVVMYQTLSGVDAAAAQTMFILYAVGLVPGLFIGGPLSDRRGRRNVVAYSLLLSAASSALLMLGVVDDSWLYVGRLLAGLASGAGFSAGAAWVKEAASDSSGARHVVIAMTSGFALGPLVAGLLSALAPHPEVVAYLPHLAVTLLAMVLVVQGRATAACLPHPRPQPSTDASSTSRAMLRDPRFVRLVAPLAPWVFLTAAVALSVLPGAVTVSQGSDRALIFSALVTPMPAGAGIVVQSLTRRLAGRLQSQIVLGFAFAAAGFVVGAWAVHAASLPGVVVAAIMLGFSYGACQTVGLGEVARISRPARLGQNTAIYQALTYVGYLAPLPIVLLTGWWSLPHILIALAVLAVATAVLIMVYLRKALP